MIALPVSSPPDLHAYDVTVVTDYAEAGFWIPVTKRLWEVEPVLKLFDTIKRKSPAAFVELDTVGQELNPVDAEEQANPPVLTPMASGKVN